MKKPVRLIISVIFSVCITNSLVAQTSNHVAPDKQIPPILVSNIKSDITKVYGNNSSESIYVKVNQIIISTKNTRPKNSR